MVLLLLLIVFLTVTGLVFLIGQYLARERILMGERVKRLEGEKITPPEDSWVEQTLRPLTRDLGNFLRSLTPAAMQQKLQKKLVLAGSPFGWQINDWLVFQALTAILFPLGITLVLALCSFPGPQLLVLFFLLLSLGVLGPELWLRQLIRERQKQIICALPDTLDLLSVSVQAGLGFDSALAKVVEKTKGPLAENLGKVLQEIRMGKGRKEALKDLSEKTGVNDLSSFIAAIIQADQLGVSITNVLKIQSEQMRQKRRQRAEEAAMKAPVKMLFPLVFFIFPTIFIILLGPAIIQMITVFSGLKGG